MLPSDMVFQYKNWKDFHNTVQYEANYSAYGSSVWTGIEFYTHTPLCIVCEALVKNLWVLNLRGKNMLHNYVLIKAIISSITIIDTFYFYLTLPKSNALILKSTPKLQYSHQQSKTLIQNVSLLASLGFFPEKEYLCKWCFGAQPDSSWPDVRVSGKKNFCCFNKQKNILNQLLVIVCARSKILIWLKMQQWEITAKNTKIYFVPKANCLINHQTSQKGSLLQYISL